MMDVKIVQLFILIITTTTGAVSQRLQDIPLRINLCCPLAPIRPQSFVDRFDCENEKYSGTEGVTYPWMTPPGLSNNGTINFRIQYRNITCVDGREGILTAPFSQPPLADSSSVGFLQPVATFLSNAYLKHGTEFFHKNEYCLNKQTMTTLEIRICEPKCSPKLGLLRKPVSKKKKKRRSTAPYEEEERETACIRKCCDPGKSLKYGAKFSCVEDKDPFRPRLRTEKMKPLSAEEMAGIDFHYSKLNIVCESGARLFFPFSKEMAEAFHFSNICFRPKWDGQVFYLHTNKKWLAPTAYCIDSVVDFKSNWSNSGQFTEESEMGIVMCSNPSSQSALGTSRKLYGGLMISSSIFLLLTFIVYLLLWNQHGLHGWTTLGHSSSMFFMYIFLGTAHILQVQTTNGLAVLKTMECVAVGVLSHFFFLSTFCWLTLISFDLWYTFRSFSPNSSKSKSARRFCFYVFFGWGVPTVFVIISRILDNTLGNDACSTVILPQYGQLSCYVHPQALAEYIYYPIAFLLLLNLVFFGITTWKLYQYRQSTRVATENLESKRQFFKLFLKLFCVMGVTWIFEVVSFLHVGTDIPWYWNIVDSVNVCQAIAVFIIYVCKKETVFALRKTYPALKVILDPLIRLFRCVPPTSDHSATHSSTMRKYSERARASMLSRQTTQRSTTGSTMETDA